VLPHAQMVRAEESATTPFARATRPESVRCLSTHRCWLTIKGCQNALPALNALSLGARERRHIDSRHQLTEASSPRVRGRGLRRARASDGTTPRRPRANSDCPAATAYETRLRALTSLDTPNRFAAGRAADGNQYAGASLRVVGTAFANRPSLWRCSQPPITQSLALRAACSPGVDSSGRGAGANRGTLCAPVGPGGDHPSRRRRAILPKSPLGDARTSVTRTSVLARPPLSPPNPS
jgi:hypothetical protein